MPGQVGIQTVDAQNLGGQRNGLTETGAQLGIMKQFQMVQHPKILAAAADLTHPDQGWEPGGMDDHLKFGVIDDRRDFSTAGRVDGNSLPFILKDMAQKDESIVGPPNFAAGVHRVAKSGPKTALLSLFLSVPLHLLLFKEH